MLAHHAAREIVMTHAAGAEVGEGGHGVVEAGMAARGSLRQVWSNKTIAPK
jgi:hypothetical protein